MEMRENPLNTPEERWQFVVDGLERDVEQLEKQLAEKKADLKKVEVEFELVKKRAGKGWER